MREIARVLAEEEPTRPSMVVATTQERLTPQAVSEVREGDPNRLRKRLEGDLDCIVLTALHKEPCGGTARWKLSARISAAIWKTGP